MTLTFNLFNRKLALHLLVLWGNVYTDFDFFYVFFELRARTGQTDA